MLFSQSLQNSLFFAMHHCLLADNKKPCPSWSGFMQQVTRGQYSSAAVVQMMSLIDMNPGDKTCICSAVNNVFLLLTRQRSSAFHCPCITFDLRYGWKPLTLPEQKSWIVLFTASVGFICSYTYGQHGKSYGWFGLGGHLLHYGHDTVSHMMTG